MNDNEALEIMRRCKEEIKSLRQEIGVLRPQAEAYQTVAQILALLPHRSVGEGEDMVWMLDKRIREIEALTPANVPT